MKIVTVSRKPVAESSATANVVKWEAEALNIDASRIVGPAWKWGTQTDIRGGGYGSKRPADGHVFARNIQSDPAGRWPANFLLIHRPGCRQMGTTVIPGYTINRFVDGAKPFGGGAGHDYETQVFPDEEVQVWECVGGCPVRDLEAQTGVTRSTGGKGAASGLLDNPSVYGTYSGKNKGETAGGFGNQGTVARYFKQMKSEDMTQLPQELWGYLVTLISAPPSCEPLLIVSDTLEDVEWGAYEDQSVHGMVTVGNPEPHMKEIDRVLRPGAHLLVIAPDEEPSGHTGACAVEDFGYEIRDAIAVFDEPGEFYYIPKPSTSEKNAGVAEHLDSRTKKMVQNNHETVKSIAIMEALLQDVPKDALVVDPFLGSGTTSLACLRTGHAFIGIEQDAEYIKICDQRARYWDRAFVAWRGATIESEAVFEKEDEEPVSVGEFFGF